MTYTTQKQKILDHLKEHGSITSWTAIQTYRITRLSEYIRSLRHDGLNISSVKEKNEETHWVRYELYKGEGQGVFFSSISKDRQW